MPINQLIKGLLRIISKMEKVYYGLRMDLLFIKEIGKMDKCFENFCNII